MKRYMHIYQPGLGLVISRKYFVNSTKLLWLCPFHSLCQKPEINFPWLLFLRSYVWELWCRKWERSIFSSQLNWKLKTLYIPVTYFSFIQSHTIASFYKLSLFKIFIFYNILYSYFICNMENNPASWIAINMNSFLHIFSLFAVLFYVN